MKAELEVCLEVFRRWLHLPDEGHVLLVLAAVVANRAPGDPVWPLLIAGPSWGKTEALNSLRGQPDVHETATLTEAALLSGTPKRDRGNAKGGKLREIGEFGIIVTKDFGSVLSMSYDTRAGTLAALREIYDGSWTRLVGVDGGRTLHWEGKIGLIAGCTPVIDSHHAVLSQLGDRFVFYRLPDDDGYQHAHRALLHGGQEKTMRADLAEAARIVLESADMEIAAAGVRGDEEERLIHLAELAVRSRSAVERDSRTREITLIPQPEAPSRLVICLLRLLNAIEAIGADRAMSWQVVTKCALDSMPAIRRRVAEALLATDKVGAAVLGTQLGYPTSTTRRALEDLTAHGVAQRRKAPKPGEDDDLENLGERDLWSLTEWARERWPHVPEKSPHTGRGQKREKDQSTPTDFSGTWETSPNGSVRVEQIAPGEWRILGSQKRCCLGLWAGCDAAAVHAREHGWEVSS